MKHFQFKGKFSDSKGVWDFQIPLISFIDDNTHIIYCPVLDLSGYGNDETEARKSFDTVLEEFLKYTIAKNTLWKDLKNLGWTIRKSKKSPEATPPSLSGLLETNQEFSRIFNNYPFKKYNTALTLPAA
ncbi:MAG: hypothetical protein JNK14_02285 [Chitinophagaceae bacterium]|nr:hypothetical protein [Chitinophagaceae bacterium]